MAAGHGDVFAVRAEGGDAAALPFFRSDALFFAGIHLVDEGLVVANEEDRLAVRGPASLRAFGDGFGVRAVAVHQPDFREAAAEGGVEDAFAVGREARIGVGVVTTR